MPRQRNAIPAYLLHKATGYARVRIDGKDHYLGEYGSDESRVKYGQLIAQHSAGVPIDPFEKSLIGDDGGPTVSELLVAFKSHSEKYYVKNGKFTAEVHCFRCVIRVARELYSAISISDFTPGCLEACRKKFVANGWTRIFCNKSTNRLRHIFKWGVSKGLVPLGTWQMLETLAPLRKGHTSAPDRKKRKSVSVVHQEACREHLCEEDQRCFDLLRFSGARPAEILGLSMEDIDRSGEVWVADLEDHKCLHLDQERRLYFGPRCQEVLKKCPQIGKLFNFSRDRFSRRVKKACVAAGITPFVPYELRHTAGTDARDNVSTEASQGLLGHAKPDMTAKYAKRIDKLAKKAAAAIG